MIPINNYPAYRICEDGTVIGARGKPLKPDLNSTGYKRVTLCKDGITERFFLHRLVAEHFCDNPEALPSVNHKDGNRLNCHKDNLEWCTNSYNVKDGFLRGRRNPNRISEELESKIEETWVILGSKKHTALALGVSVDTVHRVIKQFVEM